MLGRHVKSLQYYEQVLRVEPEPAMYWNNKGLALQNLGRYYEVKEAYLEALERDPESLKATYNLANTLQSLGRAPGIAFSVR
jgi:tetratricopeptide (TPR) repeat protein